MKKGFTLIELLIVISIIGILAVALLPNIISAPASARDAGRKSSLNSVLTALEQYKASNGAYPGAAGTATCLPSGLNSFFKGSAAPAGAPNTTGPADTVMGASGCSPTSGNSQVVYCPLATNSQGYSYVVGIRMEQPMTGSASSTNTLTIATTCASMVSSGSYTAPTLTSGNTNWYYLAQ
ncbi:type II secretion system protein [Candidatus Peregrinibacteria bacterium]|nr:type II secretion system protein [Candidatus Peregrinibacteria bacterium]